MQEDRLGGSVRPFGQGRLVVGDTSEIRRVFLREGRVDVERAPAPAPAK